MDTNLQIVIVAGFGLFGAIMGLMVPLITVWLTNRNMLAAKANDYKRQDEVADRLQKSQDAVAEKVDRTAKASADGMATLARQQLDATKAVKDADQRRREHEEIAVKAVDVAQSTAVVVKEQLHDIHDLVNSAMTLQLQDSLELANALLASMVEVMHLRQSEGKDAPPEAVAAVNSLREKIAALRSKIFDRLQQAKAMEARIG